MLLQPVCTTKRLLFFQSSCWSTGHPGYAPVCKERARKLIDLKEARWPIHSLESLPRSSARALAVTIGHHCSLLSMQIGLSEKYHCRTSMFFAICLEVYSLSYPVDPLRNGRRQPLLAAQVRKFEIRRRTWIFESVQLQIPQTRLLSTLTDISSAFLFFFQECRIIHSFPVILDASPC